MSNKEALEILCKGIAPNPTANNECIKLCKSALEKQMPKRVKIEVVDDFDPRTNEPYQFKIPICTACGENIALRIYKFCPNCGQALDWGDRE